MGKFGYRVGFYGGAHVDLVWKKANDYCEVAKQFVLRCVEDEDPEKYVFRVEVEDAGGKRVCIVEVYPTTTYSAHAVEEE